ncbi:hypothetical protein ACKF11_14995 [Methylobacillus sp. Pita2]|uniref:hypothetical protein n=1 Tax=Methylobacillus sp. Pita2 TaxID=3383245 RepID=UPI0038B431DD
MTAAHLPHSRHAQRGAALLLAMFIIGLAVTALVVRSYDAAGMKARQEEKTMKALAEAKEALIAWSVAHPEFPGAMPYPDRGSGGSYDGESDCFNAANEFKRYFLIGMLPILDSRDTNCLNSLRKGISINSLPSSLNMRGKYGDRLWYAVSRNLVHNYEFSKDAAKNEKENIPPIINLGLAMANEIFANESLYNPPYLRRKSKQDDAIGSTPYRWLKVVDSRGAVISDRVAAVIIAPGLPLAGQDRSADAPLPAAYLDALGGFSNADYQVDDETFIQAPESSNFNDRLVYITIDELLSALEKRVVREVRTLNFTPDMVRCTLSGCAKVFTASLKWSNAGAYATTGTIDADYYHKLNDAQNFNCNWRLQDIVACEATALDARENLLNIRTPMAGYPFVFDRMTGQEAITVLDKDRNKKGTIGPAQNSYFVVNDESPITDHAGWPQWYFTNKWHEYIYAVAEEFDSTTGEGRCLSSCLSLQVHGRSIQGIKQLVFSRALANISELAKGTATNSFAGVNGSEGAVAWKQ